jgi:hypothetical protein
MYIIETADDERGDIEGKYDWTVLWLYVARTINTFLIFRIYHSVVIILWVSVDTIVYYFNWQLYTHLVSIITHMFVNSCFSEVHFVIKFVSDSWKVGDFLQWNNRPPWYSLSIVESDIIKIRLCLQRPIR